MEAVPNGTGFKVRFPARKDGTITYLVRFSHDLFQWENNAAVPVVVSDDGGDVQVMEVPYPFFLSNGRKARYFQVVASAN